MSERRTDAVAVQFTLGVLQTSANLLKTAMDGANAMESATWRAAVVQECMDVERDAMSMLGVKRDEVVDE